jgi:hypothetical protein
LAIFVLLISFFFAISLLLVFVSWAPLALDHFVEPLLVLK